MTASFAEKFTTFIPLSVVTEVLPITLVKLFPFPDLSLQVVTVLPLRVKEVVSAASNQIEHPGIDNGVVGL
jgi:hypothetical protein